MKRRKERNLKPIDILFSKTRQAVLKSTFLQADRWWYLNELSKHLNVSPSSLQLELPDLHAAGFFLSRQDGNRTYYKANPEFQLFQEMRQILLKTIGLTDVLKNLLEPFRNQIDFAFVFGSLARRDEHVSSDVDLMIVGTIRLSDMTKQIRNAETELERPINITHYTSAEIKNGVKNKNNFVLKVLRGEKIKIIGDLDDLEKTFRKKTDSGTRDES